MFHCFNVKMVQTKTLLFVQNDTVITSMLFSSETSDWASHQSIKYHENCSISIYPNNKISWNYCTLYLSELILTDMISIRFPLNDFMYLVEKILLCSSWGMSHKKYFRIFSKITSLFCWRFFLWKCDFRMILIN